MWWKPFEALELHGGRINFICDDCEDMIEIFYEDGMMIDIGKPERMDLYIITVVSSNDAIGWKQPLAEIEVPNRANLFDRIQETIINFRNHKGGRHGAGDPRI